MATAKYDPTVTLYLSAEEARALVVLIGTKVKGSRDPITTALFDIEVALQELGFNFLSDFHYGVVEIEQKDGTVVSTGKTRDQTGISFRDVPADVLTWPGDDYY